ncbi:hypothetical protein [Streptomyces hygroscopicus]|uniref:hypothetical protein n=1 Tax=Streptomyces hygroscopicus TaxID=1912 RepID=UPI001F1B484F|nr:hypothetical protein [Streptomyces hygroscopicus]
MALLPFEAAQDQLDLGGEATGGAIVVAPGAGGVEDTAGVCERLLAWGHDAVHAAARSTS